MISRLPVFYFKPSADLLSTIGLVTLLTFESNSINGTTLSNRAPSGVDCTLVGPTADTTNFKRGIQSILIASPQSITHPNFQITPLGVTGTGTTICMWFRCATFANTNLLLYGFNPNFYSGYIATSTAFFVNANPSGAIIFNCSTLNVNQWYHVAYTCAVNASATGDYKCYLNGVSISPQTNTYPNSALRTSNIIAGNTTSNPGYAGNLDDFRVYNRVLSLTEVNVLVTNSNYPN